MPARFAIINTKCVARVKSTQPGMFFQFADRHRARTAVGRFRIINECVGSYRIAMASSCPRAPGQSETSETSTKRTNRYARFLAMFENRHQQRCDAHRFASATTRERRRQKANCRRLLGRDCLRSGNEPHSCNSHSSICCPTLVVPISPQSVPHAAMAMDAKQHLARRIFGEHLMHRIGMARNTGSLSDTPIPPSDLDRLVKILQCERQRMIEAVVRLGKQRTK